MGIDIDAVMVVVVLAAAVWWGSARRRGPALLDVLSAAVAGAAALRRWRPGRSRRWRRTVARVALVGWLALGALALLTAVVPALPRPAGPHGVGSVVLRWTDAARPETFTADPGDHRQVVAQAWYPTDATGGERVPYFEAQGRLPASVSGLPSVLFGSFGSVATHAIAAAPGSPARRTWPVLFFSPGLSVPREQYTALCADLASRGFVVVALSVPYESGVSVLADGEVVGQATHPDVAGPPPHRALERLIEIRAADVRFALDRLGELARLDPGSPLAGRLDLRHVGIVGHSLGGRDRRLRHGPGLPLRRRRRRRRQALRG